MEHTHYKKATSAGSFYMIPSLRAFLPCLEAQRPVLEHTLATSLLRNGDLNSSGELHDYPIISDAHRRLHFADWEVLPIVRPVVISKPTLPEFKCSEEKLRKIWERKLELRSESAKAARASKREEKTYHFEL